MRRHDLHAARGDPVLEVRNGCARNGSRVLPLRQLSRCDGAPLQQLSRAARPGCTAAPGALLRRLRGTEAADGPSQAAVTMPPVIPEIHLPGDEA